jgi:hypothetical protein
MGSNRWDLFFQLFNYSTGEVESETVTVNSNKNNYAIYFPSEITSTHVLIIAAFTTIVTIYYMKKRILSKSIRNKNKSSELFGTNTTTINPPETFKTVISNINEVQSVPFKSTERPLTINDVNQCIINLMRDTANQNFIRFSKEMNITTWLQEVETHCSEYNILDKYTFILDHLDNECSQFIQEFQQIQHISNYDELKRALRSIFESKKKQNTLEHEFYSRTQNTNETVIVFYLSLVQLAESAFYDIDKEIIKQRIRNQFISNLHDKYLSQLLRFEPVTDIESIVQKARVIELNVQRFSPSYTQYELAPVFTNSAHTQIYKQDPIEKSNQNVRAPIHSLSRTNSCEQDVCNESTNWTRNYPTRNKQYNNHNRFSYNSNTNRAYIPSHYTTISKQKSFLENNEYQLDPNQAIVNSYVTKQNFETSQSSSKAQKTKLELEQQINK